MLMTEKEHNIVHLKITNCRNKEKAEQERNIIAVLGFIEKYLHIDYSMNTDY